MVGCPGWRRVWMGMEVFGPGLLESPWEGIRAATGSNCVTGLATKGHKIWAGT